MHKAMKGILDLFIIVAGISLIIGIISRILLKPFPFGLEAQAYLQFTQTMLLFALAIGIRQFLRAKDK
jgi:hypothetical protein